MKKVLYFFLFIVSIVELSSQGWVDRIKDPSNFYSIRQAYTESNAAEKTKFEELKNGEDSETQFRRWEYMLEPRLYPSGKLPPSGYLLNELNNFYENNIFDFDTLRRADWRPLDSPDGFPLNGFSGRLNCIAFHPKDTNIIFVGSPSGGLWKTTDGGNSWIPLTDNLPSLGVSEIVINYKNPDIMYMATGDRDAAFFISNPYSYGLLKSTDGGNTWLTTGLNHVFEDQMTIQRLIMHPSQPNILLAAITGINGANRGIWRTMDGGASWKDVSGGGKFDVEFNPGDPNIVYCSGYKYLAKSTNAGADWAVINSPVLPSAEVTSAKIAVTPANPHLVVVQYLNPANGYTYGLYKSWDDGTTWSKINSSAISTQSGYDWVLTVSPTDTNLIFYGGQELFGSEDAGVNRTNYTSGHVDHHDLTYRPGSNVLYNCNDGGLYKSYNNAGNWINLNKGLLTLQYYRLGSSVTNKDFILTGAQDNGTQKHNLPIWTQIGYMADGTENIIDYTDETIYYVAYQYGMLTRYGSGIGTFRSPPTSGSSVTCAWVTPYLMHPRDPKILYFGAKDIYKTTNRGNQWAAISDQLTAKDGVGGGMLRAMAISESNPDSVLYAASYVVVYKTTNGGATWTDVTSNLPTNAGPFTGSAISSLCVHPDSPQTAWVTMSGFSKENKVFRTNDGGISWTNISDNLPAIPVNTIVYQKGNNDGLYIGTDIGVFYRDSTMDKWIPFMNYLPNVPVQELEIHYGSGKLRAATFGRGLWETSLYGDILDVNSVSADGINISPNPASDYIEIKLPRPLGEGWGEGYSSGVSIFDILGIEVLKGMDSRFRGNDSHFSEGKIKLDVSSLSPGMYFVRVGDVVRKFIKK